MKDTDLYSQILGLSAPWVVDAVELNTAEGRVDIHVGHGPGVRWACPICGRELACRDHAEPRVWRHLDTCQFKTLLHARIPRVDCPDHGVVQVKVPWAENKGRFTLLMERLIIGNRQKNPFLRLLSFLTWSVPRRDDHGSIRNGA